jgi:hypothetical protein
MKVSEKSLELNVGAELLWLLRHTWGLPKAYLRGLTQAEERQEGVDFFVHLDPATRIYAFQFKAPKGRVEKDPYKYTLVKYQHDQLHALAAPNPGCVFYVFPFYVSPTKLQANVPDLLSDTWILDVAPMTPSAVFGIKKTATISCSSGKAKVNPEYELARFRATVDPTSERADEIAAIGRLQVERSTTQLRHTGLSPSTFAEWYYHFRVASDQSEPQAVRGDTWRSSWFSRGLRVIIVPPPVSEVS